MLRIPMGFPRIKGPTTSYDDDFSRLGQMDYPIFYDMGVSKNRGILPPKWMVKIMENRIKIDDLEAKHPIFGSTPT